MSRSWKRGRCSANLTRVMFVQGLGNYLHFEIYATVAVVVACFFTLYFWGKYQIQGILMDFGFSPKEAEELQTKNKSCDMWSTLHFMQKEKMDNISARKYIQEKLTL